jgi:3D (Asp-Asp-Asp) domain-containing protein
MSVLFNTRAIQIFRAKRRLLKKGTRVYVIDTGWGRIVEGIIQDIMGSLIVIYLIKQDNGDFVKSSEYMVISKKDF